MGWDGELQGYFLKYQNRQDRQYLLSVHLRGSDLEVGLLSDARVTKIAVSLEDAVYANLLPDMERMETTAYTIDGGLIQPHGFKPVDEKWLSNFRQTL